MNFIFILQSRLVKRCAPIQWPLFAWPSLLLKHNHNYKKTRSNSCSHIVYVYPCRQSTGVITISCDSVPFQGVSKSCQWAATHSTSTLVRLNGMQPWWTLSCRLSQAQRPLTKYSAPKRQKVRTTRQDASSLSHKHTLTSSWARWLGATALLLASTSVR